MSEIVLEVVDLVKQYPLGGQWFGPTSVAHAVDGVSFALGRGETLALVGESGCGKSTLAKCTMRLIEPSSGTIKIVGRDITIARGEKLRAARRLMQIIFQNPYASLNPRRTVFKAIADPLRVHAICARRHRRSAAEKLLAQVGLGAEYLDRYPHELSGGQQQRVAIARALAVRPQIIICDEPVSALDVSVQAQVINLLLRLQNELGLSYLFISHNLALARRISHRLAVMYLGRVVEVVESADLESGLMHPYSQALFAAALVPDPHAARRARQPLAGEPPSPVNLPPGCRFCGRCNYKQEICAATEPPLTEVDGHLVRCHFAGSLHAVED